MTPNHPAAIAMFARVAALYSVDAAILWRKGKQSPSIIEARQLAMWALRERTRWSYPELGLALGVDHTAVLHGVRRSCERAGKQLGTGFLQDAVLALGLPWGTGERPPPEPVRQPVNETRTDPVQNPGQPVICPPSLVLSPSALPSGSDLLSADSSSLLSSGSGPVSRPAREAKPKPRKWTFVPADWQPNDDHRKRARMLRVNLDEEVQNFREHEFKAPKSDADRAFLRWLKTAAKGFGAGPAPGFTQHQAQLAVDSSQRPELVPIRPSRPVQEASPLEVAAALGQVLGKRPQGPPGAARRMTAAELDRAVDEMREGRDG